MKYRDIAKYIKESLKPVGDSDDVKVLLEAIYEGLQKGIAKHDHPGLQNKYTVVKMLCDSILEVIDLLNSNRRQEAHNKLFDLYFKDDNRDRLQLYKVKSDTCFYKMRAAERFTQYLVKEGKAGMYHIPFELRHKVGNDRYGISGFPVFYLSSSVYGCWEELKRPNLEFANIALFKSTKELQFLDMVPPSEEKSLDKTSLLSLPLVLASRLEVKHPGENYIQEYSIPQLVMECLIESRVKGKIDAESIIGVRYESIHRSDAGLLFDEVDKDDISVNYAIPPFKSMEKGICPVIMSLFYLWNCTSWAEMTYRYSSWSVPKETKTHYEDSKFGILEKYLNLRDIGMQTYHTRNKGGIPIGALTI